jgi:hypothetical protein
MDRFEESRVEKLIADIESAGKFYTMRFEPHVYERTKQNIYSDAVNRARQVNQVSLATARMIVSTSWGGFQIMGFNLYDKNVIDLHLPVGIFLKDKSLQRAAFWKYCKARNIAYTVNELRDETKRRDFARKYNGDVDGYAALIEMRIRSFNV